MDEFLCRIPWFCLYFLVFRVFQLGCAVTTRLSALPFWYCLLPGPSGVEHGSPAALWSSSDAFNHRRFSNSACLTPLNRVVVTGVASLMPALAGSPAVSIGAL